MRVFFGVDLPDEIKASVSDITARVQRGLARRAPKASVRWVTTANLHITLWFIGEIKDDAVEPLASAARAAFHTTAFELTFDQLGVFPPSGGPRVIWLGIQSGADALRSIYDELQPRLVALGYEPERRRYSPHLTIGRVKELRRSDVQPLRTALQMQIEPLHAPVNAVTLFRSRLSPKGSQYEPLMRVPLS